ncbi:hypothetical protein CcaverHIS002_0300190 [Cutaneotrichosporon cavernicola]|uniref:Adenine DNA glycosylase n=1 Tax=Cutaneotrichosporon cavernicola TaxID=279322 RepID=A0AA48I2D7_9TREE|nr:uncharacterized protein CcaverHIS019_0300190 [Cutaneotrichosporon cavernicola]BEI82151.1 hypothetical protein CcaverHIS002_0300190 [Cutaneotrichosporon cavernicola]BEI89949.1 hypothetical protein CcaverHIS019_0300190 [Cutaneotrichosporon cavernicola]BEI97722.1 hypothetical protein CcaverHIS631_0300210 [Cutaneotrichosporon cavernicola]BEJ05499.1 hypothetical protein CcaverHIS641_0300210 [Cutaneotrichosporon cavernicola]
MRPRRAAAAAARMLRVPSSSPSVIAISDSESDAFVPPDVVDNEDVDFDGQAASASSSLVPSDSGSDPGSGQRGRKRKRAGPRPRQAAGRANSRTNDDIEDCVRPHGSEYHSVNAVAEKQQKLLDWFEDVRDARGMPWRKRYDAAATAEEKGQRAYEIWVSEVMLQQTQVATVIDYWNRWMARWPTIADLAKADLEEVNAVWRGLGYYRRAKSLLAGAAVITGSEEYNQRLPSDPSVLEKNVPGVGRYTAGAICSMAYGVRTPIVDGNIHRVLTRLLGVYATQTAPATIRFLWDAAEALVDALPRRLSLGIAGDWNQALMELGATVCRPVPVCGECPLREVCNAHAEADMAKPPPPPTGVDCTLCEPVPGEMAVTVFPMKKMKKESRVEHEAVVITEWQSEGVTRWLFLKRPEKGLLAGLFEPPTTVVPATGAVEQLAAGLTFVTDLVGDIEDAFEEHVVIGPITHIFSHINMTYHVQRLVLRGERPEPKNGQWLSLEEVSDANVGTGVKKCWASVYGVWGEGEVGTVKLPKPKKELSAKRVRKEPVVKKVKKDPARRLTEEGARVFKKVCMPVMPKRGASAKEVKAEVEVVGLDD